MLANWRRKREVKRLQALCPHDWRKVRAYRGETYNGYDVDFHDAVTVYCPLCDAKKDVCAARAEEIFGIQEIRRHYETGGDSG